MIDAKTFKSQTGMVFATGRGTQLQAVDSALETYNKTPTPDNATKLANAIIAWAKVKGLKSNGDINTDRNPAVVRQLVTDVSNTRGGEALKNLRGLVGVAKASTTGGLPAKLIGGVIGELDRCKNFACTDVGTFSGDINRALPKQRQKEIYDKGTSQGRATGIALIPKTSGNGTWDLAGLQSAYNRVFSSAAGECTSFAKAAGYILSARKPLPEMPKLEIVSFRNQRQVPRMTRNPQGKMVPLFKKDKFGNFTDQPAMEYQYVTHVFCVVGRSGPEVAYNGVMPDAKTWGADCRIVDCWLGALGYNCSYTVDQYPKTGYLTPGLVFKEMGT